MERKNGGYSIPRNGRESDHGDYVGFPHAQNKALYRDLATILSESNLWGWGAAFDLASWREIFPTVDQDLSYLRGFFTVVSEVEEYSKLQFNDVVKFTFDSRERSNYYAGKIYNLIANEGINPFIFDEVSFASSRKQPRLQIADLFTYEVMKELDNRDKRPRRKSMAALNERGHFGCDVFLREYFLDMKEKLHLAQERDPKFTFAAYQDWLNKNNKQDSPRNSIMFFIWFLENEKRERDKAFARGLTLPHV